MSRFEISAAYALGVALPILEASRRRTHFDDLPAYLDDFIIGGLLLWAAWAASHRRPYGEGLLVAAWGILCGGLWGSFFGQMQNPEPRDISGLANGPVVLIKGGIYLVALIALCLSIRRLAARAAHHR